MSDRARRRELRDQYREARPEAGVYRIVNGHSGRALLGSTPNLASLRNRLEFARSTNTPGALDHRLVEDARRDGVGVFRFEVLEVLDTKPEATPAQIRRDLAVLEGLWREKLDPAALY